ncbi:MAG TPA: galactokinase [Chloroflexi bacterium]|nr:galactokinase [Chloroflexota bacterium]
MMGKETVIREFTQRWGSLPEVVVQAPGRVNLIGEHTDYNNGFVLPVAVNRYIWVAASRNSERKVTLYAINFREEVTFPLDDIQFDGEKPWSNYQRGVAYVLQQEGFRLPGIKAVIGGDVPIGAGLSSSAAVEVAMALAFQLLGGFEIERPRLALLCQRAENEFVGMRCGIMDQFTSLLARENCALFLDCATLEYRYVPLPEDVSIVVADTGIKRELAASEYNLRRQQCEDAVQLLHKRWPSVNSLRDVDPASMPGWEELLPEPLRRRARHVVNENNRVLQAVKALERGDAEEFGRLMNQSHISLRDDYEVSCPELDLLVETAWQTEGVYGSRLTGAGFGGCTITLVARNYVTLLERKLKDAYQACFGVLPRIYDLQAVRGADTAL